MWNDTDVPLAYLITFRCYGTWLHGDARGSIDRFHNVHKESYLLPNRHWHTHNANALKSEAVLLDAQKRRVVEDAIRETCKIREWSLQAINVRTNHVHVVASIGLKKPEHALNAFKANSTRKLREIGCWTDQHSPWADKGSVKHLWNIRSIEQATDYVVMGQGDRLPDFD